MSLFSTPKAPQEDPSVTAARQRQQQLADDDLTAQIQTDLRRRTRVNLQQYGALPAASSPSGFFTPAVTGAA